MCRGPEYEQRKKFKLEAGGNAATRTGTSNYVGQKGQFLATPDRD